MSQKQFKTDKQTLKKIYTKLLKNRKILYSLTYPEKSNHLKSTNKTKNLTVNNFLINSWSRTFNLIQIYTLDPSHKKSVKKRKEIKLNIKIKIEIKRMINHKNSRKKIWICDIVAR